MRSPKNLNVCLFEGFKSAANPDNAKADVSVSVVLRHSYKEYFLHVCFIAGLISMHTNPLISCTEFGYQDYSADETETRFSP